MADFDFWDTFFIPLLSIGVPSNLFSIGFCIAFHQKLHGLGVFILNLAVADFLLLCSAWYYKYNRVLPIVTNWSCKLFTAVDIASLYASCGTLVLVAYKRLQILNGSQTTIVFRLVHVSQSKKDALFCLAIWVLGICMSIPMAIAMASTEDRYGCFSAFPETIQKFYSVMVFLTAWLVPASACILIYIHILRKVFHCSRGMTSSSANVESSSQIVNTSSDRRGISRLILVKIMTIITILYWFFHLPFWVVYISDSLQLFETPKVVRAWSVAATYLNSTINPFVYLLLSQKKALKVFFCFLKFVFCSIYCELLYLVICTDAYDNYFATDNFNSSNQHGEKYEEPGRISRGPSSINPGKPKRGDKSENSTKKANNLKCRSELPKLGKSNNLKSDSMVLASEERTPKEAAVAEITRKNKISLQVAGNFPGLGESHKIAVQLRLSSERNNAQQNAGHGQKLNATGTSAISSVWLISHKLFSLLISRSFNVVN